MSAVQELDAALQPMLQLKPPGVSGTKIKDITALCVANIQSESVLIQKIYTHFKKAPATHKLGVLYVVDSVTRQWVDHARKAGQPIASTAVDGTYAAGVNRVTELLPVMMTDLIQQAPEDQKEKIRKLVDIWERGNTFPSALLSVFKEKIDAGPGLSSTTPPGSPPTVPAQPEIQAQAVGALPAAPNTSAILAALANIAKQNTAVAPLQPPAPPPTSTIPHGQTYSASQPQNMYTLSGSAPANEAPSFSSAAQPEDVHAAASTGGAQGFPAFNLGGAGSLPPAQQVASNPLAAMAALIPAMSGGQAKPEALQQQLMLIQVLIQQGVPQEQWATVLSALQGAGATGVPANTFTGMTSVLGANNMVGGAPTGWPPATGASGGWRSDQLSRDRNAMPPPDMIPRSPTEPHQRRGRSRSPSNWGRDRESSPPQSRDSPTYGEYHGDPSGRQGHRGEAYDRNGRGRGGRARGNDYRQRSPPHNRQGRSPTPPSGSMNIPPAKGPRPLDWDPSIGNDKIRVLSRTLFIGGVTCTEDDLRAVFSQFGTVQTSIVNQEKRHGFIKMISRADALAAKAGMEHYRNPSMQLRTRWGVGFGPRDCSDYQAGVSVIPISRLTDADRKWLLSAEYGGTGGKPVEGGMVIEEPDIEIGAGVSSKAISRRVPTDTGGKSGPRSTRFANPPPPPPNRGNGDWDQRRNRDYNEHANNNIGVPPAVPGFGFQFPNFGGNGMLAMMPPGGGYPMFQNGNGQQGPAGQN